ncbi:MAG: cyclic nucleotide-binding domain-containing protein [Syntrophales bacterium LBB04]|nr:cyclic nucleotide-binding domain-containing protein [Syntrophales bacterium LBB04]
MFTRTKERLVWAMAIVTFWVFAAPALAAEAAKPLELSQALTQVKLFAGLNALDRGALKAAVKLRRGQAGELIVQQGKAMDRMFIILDGGAEVRVNGKQVTTLSGQPLVGEIEFLDLLPASADVLLLEDTDLLELNCAALTRLMEKKPRLGYKLMREIARIEARRLRDTNPK